jgi:hypothetical protein
MPNKNWIVTTSDERPLKEVVSDLEKAGFTIGKVNDQIQSVTGSAAADALDRLRSITGVIDVSPDEPIDIGPPGSSDTW